MFVAIEAGLPQAEATEQPFRAVLRRLCLVPVARAERDTAEHERNTQEEVRQVVTRLTRHV